MSSSDAAVNPSPDPPGTSVIGSTVDLATGEPKSVLDKALQWVPRILSSKPHVIVLMGLGIYLIVLPLAGVNVSARSELIGGNYTNVTSDIGACIAAGWHAAPDQPEPQAPPDRGGTAAARAGDAPAAALRLPRRGPATRPHDDQRGRRGEAHDVPGRRGRARHRGGPGVGGPSGASVALGQAVPVGRRLVRLRPEGGGGFPGDDGIRARWRRRARCPRGRHAPGPGRGRNPAGPGGRHVGGRDQRRVRRRGPGGRRGTAPAALAGRSPAARVQRDAAGPGRAAGPVGHAPARDRTAAPDAG